MRSENIILKGMLEPFKSPTPYNPRNAGQLIVTPFDPKPDITTDYIIALDEECSEKFEVEIFWDNCKSNYGGLYLLKVSETEQMLHFLVLTIISDVPGDRFSRNANGSWERSSAEDSPRPVIKPSPRTVTLM